MTFRYSKEPYLGLAAVQVDGDVGHSFSIYLCHQNLFSKSSNAVLDPRFIKQIAFGSVEVWIEIETTISVCFQSNKTQGSQIFFPSFAHHGARRHD